MHNPLQQQLAFVRQTFFPAWDRQRHWNVVEVDDLDGAQGRCERETRTVSILNGIGGDDLAALLIHEIVHAVTDDHHGKRWQQRMEKAAVQAEGIGLETLAKRLREEVASYQDGLRVTAAAVYNEIADCVAQSPTVTFARVVDFVRRGYGLPRKKFFKRFRRARKVFDETRAEAKARAKARAKLLAMK